MTATGASISGTACTPALRSAKAPRISRSCARRRHREFRGHARMESVGGVPQDRGSLCRTACGTLRRQLTERHLFGYLIDDLHRLFDRLIFCFRNGFPQQGVPQDRGSLCRTACGTLRRPANFSAMMPEPTTVATRIAVPSPSAMGALANQVSNRIAASKHIQEHPNISMLTSRTNALT